MPFYFHPTKYISQSIIKLLLPVTLLLSISCSNVKEPEESAYPIREEIVNTLVSANTHIEKGELEEARLIVTLLNYIDDLSDFERYHIFSTSAKVYYQEGSTSLAASMYMLATGLEKIPTEDRIRAYNYQIKLLYKAKSYVLAFIAVDEMIEYGLTPDTEILAIAISSHLLVFPKPTSYECYSIRPYMESINKRKDRNKYIPDKKWKELVDKCKSSK